MTAVDTYLLLRAFCDELARCGVQHACTSPGSRSTPIVLSLARESRIRCWSHIDERCAAFFALGAAKASGRPVVLSCTSGTAAANYAPAVIEARHAGVPLIVLSADRPPELRDVGAGQTIDQLKLYGDAVKWFVEVGVHDADAERMRWIRTLACRAVFTALDGRPGPVHLNFPLREPLVLDAPLLEEDPGFSGREGGAPWVTIDRRQRVTGTLESEHVFRRTVFVAGALGGGSDAEALRRGEALARFAARARTPLLADPLSGARSGPAAIAHYDLLLRRGGVGDALAPDVVCRVGELPTSKPLRTWLAGLDHVHQLQFADDSSWHDPTGQIFQQRIAPLGALFEAIERDRVIPDDSDWLDRWLAADAVAKDTIAETIATEELSEPRVAQLLGQALPAEATLFIASSMPIRDVEEFVAVRPDPPRMLSNRGANGIDGTVSSAFGAAAVTGGPVVLLIGDVAVAHDIGGLLAARRLGLQLTIVLLNNDGGGIFHFLPVASQADAFEEHIATPHGLDFAHAARLYGCGYQRIETATALADAVTACLNGAGTTILEVRTDRAANRELHRAVEARVLAELARSRPARD
jgi:2-succinyl-5-enolpyruvyl-6-hydroxy-3-cyclohexene-1-carboxylate synthase